MSWSGVDGVAAVQGPGPRGRRPVLLVGREALVLVAKHLGSRALQTAGSSSSSEEWGRQITMFAFHYFWLVAVRTVRTPGSYLSSSENNDKVSSSAGSPGLIPSFLSVCKSNPLYSRAITKLIRNKQNVDCDNPLDI